MTDRRTLTGLTRMVEKGWFRKVMVLQVEVGRYPHQKGNHWRNATKAEYEAIEADKRLADQRRSSDLIFPVGRRVRATRSGFHRGCKGQVVFQEPSGGRVWVLRDSSNGPVFFYADELDLLPSKKVA